MNGINDFLNKMNEETYRVIEEEESKNLAKEDTLTLIAEFVKDVKNKFSKYDDRLEILKYASKTIDFYVNEIEESEEEIEYKEPEVEIGMGMKPGLEDEIEDFE